LITFIDNGVLLAGWRRTPIAGAAMSVLADDPRAFYPAQLVKT
jgi:hypothetical protein